jgi:hypothetical protein
VVEHHMALRLENAREKPAAEAGKAARKTFPC